MAPVVASHGRIGTFRAPLVYPDTSLRLAAPDRIGIYSRTRVVSVVMMMVVVVMMVMMFVAVMTPPVIAAMMVHRCSLSRRFLRHGLRGTGERAQEQGAAKDGAGQKHFQHSVFLFWGHSRRANWVEAGSKA